MRDSVTARTENIEQGYLLLQGWKLLIRWGILTIKFVTVNLLIGSLDDFLIFGPLHEMLNEFFDVDQNDGYGDSEQDLTLVTGGDVDAAEEYA